MPDLVLDGDGNMKVVWVAYAKQYDTATGRLIESSKSGPSSQQWEEKAAGRPDHVYMDDPEFKDWVVESMPDSPGEAVRQALAPLVGDANALAVGKLPGG